MCGRFSMHSTLGNWSQLYFPNWEIQNVKSYEASRYNIAPTQEARVYFSDAAKSSLGLEDMLWGIRLAAADDRGNKINMINARSESIELKPTFQDGLKYRRCLIPANGFFEWQSVGRKKQPYYFSHTTQDVFAFAGIWEYSTVDSSDLPVRSFCILTTNANSDLSDMHERMPVIIDPLNYSQWIDPHSTVHGHLKRLLRPLANKTLQRWAVSTVVNQVGLDTPACIQEIPHEHILKDRQTRLF